MKANAPNKIYINDFGSELSYDWHTKHCCESDIEYTRTDAFIEKAINWLRKELINFEEPVDTEKTFLNDFKKALEE